MSSVDSNLRTPLVAAASAIAAFALTITFVSPEVLAPSVGGSRVASTSSGDVSPLAFMLGDMRSVVAGAADPVAGSWVLSRDRGDDSLRLSHVEVAGITSDRVLPLDSAGIQAGLAPTSSAIWVGAGTRVLRIDRVSGLVTPFDLPAPSASVARALRAPDGTVLGLGNITSIAVDAERGAVWIARFAASSLPVLSAVDGSVSEVSLGGDHDADRLALVGRDLWFTVNYGPGMKLASAVGRLNVESRAVRYLPVFARSVAVRNDGVHALGESWDRIDPASDRVTRLLTTATPLDASMQTVDAAGRLVVRAARETKLLMLDPRGASETVGYSQGSFVKTGGGQVATNSPLAFLVNDAVGTLWFAPRGGPLVFAVN